LLLTVVWRGAEVEGIEVGLREVGIAERVRLRIAVR
jgi:hypothetical protein